MRLAIDEIVDCLPVVRQKFYADGFELPLIYLDAAIVSRILLIAERFGYSPVHPGELRKTL